MSRPPPETAEDVAVYLRDQIRDMNARYYRECRSQRKNDLHPEDRAASIREIEVRTMALADVLRWVEGKRGG